VLVKQSEGARIISYAVAAVKSLWARTPCKIEDVPLKLQPTCGYCAFLKDCTKTLQPGGDTNPHTWAVDLIPYTSPSLVQQLKDAGFRTIQDVARGISAFPSGNTRIPYIPRCLDWS